MEGLQEQVHSLVTILEDILERRSRWNGKVHLVHSLFFSGAAHYDGSISISEFVYSDPDMRWRTMLHEVLHTFSPQYTRSEYNAAQGWEEGVVEQMQRLLRTQVLATLRVTVSEETLAEVERGHPYNVYITQLEDLRQRLNDSPLNFYRMLLATLLPERALLLKRSGIVLEEQERQAFRVALLRAVLAFSR